MDRLTALLKRLETTPDVVRLNSFKPEILGDYTVGDLRQSLSPAAVRDEALEEAASVDQREVELRGWREAIRVLKRDPNAAAESYESAHPKALDEPAPAAPDVASMVKRLRNCCTMIGYATSGAERTSHKRNADDAEAALLTRLGQGWIPVSDEESLGAYLTGLPGKPIYAVDERTQPFSCWRFELPPLPPRP